MLADVIENVDAEQSVDSAMSSTLRSQYASLYRDARYRNRNVDAAVLQVLQSDAFADPEAAMGTATRRRSRMGGECAKQVLIPS